MPAMYCDRHQLARAAYVYTHGNLYLFFCGHCSRGHGVALAAQGWTCDPVTQPCGPSEQVTTP